MKFIDEISIVVVSGKGGDGSVSFRRERYVPKGGPDGGNGGRGGHVYLKGDSSINTLVQLRYKHKYKASNGKAGSGNNKTGKQGEDLFINVPCGTQGFIEHISEEGEIERTEFIGEVVKDSELLLIADGGHPGKGNACFTTSTRQAPDFATLGGLGKEVMLHLELKLLADIGLVGFPNSGKSTLLSRLTNAKPKIASYAFTTLIPNLGVLRTSYGREIVIADIPGIIEGASSGKGLGHDFLKHIERTAILLFLLDPSQGDVSEQYKILTMELGSFNKHLTQRPKIVVLTKSDLSNEYYSSIPEGFKYDLYISALTNANIFELVKLLNERVIFFKDKEIIEEGTEIKKERE